VKRRTIAWLVVPALLITAGAVKSNANNVVEIMLHGRYFSEPATVRFIVAMGAGEKRLHTFTFKNLSAGNYTLRAQVLSSHDVRGTATNEMVVTGMGLR
jgi:hypothetical protein